MKEGITVVNISDVAAAAGVSTSTVSYALSGKRSISVETRQRIDEAIQRLNFTPNAGARALKTSQTMVIGLMLQFHQDEFAPATLQYVLPITDTARRLGYDILLMTETTGPEALKRVTDSGMVDGLILLDVAHDDPRLKPLRKANRPGVLIGLPGDRSGLDVVELDFESAARTIVEHLVGMGHRDIVLITPPEHVFNRGGAYSWRFRDAAARCAGDLGVALACEYGESRQPAVDETLNRILDSHPSATALIVHNDSSVTALPHVLSARGLRVPEDMSVVSLYSANFARWFSLPYTSVDSSPEVVGRLAVEQLARRIQHAETDGTREVRFVSGQLVDRGSTRSASEPEDLTRLAWPARADPDRADRTGPTRPT